MVKDKEENRGVGGGWEELPWVEILGKEGFPAKAAFQDYLEKNSPVLPLGRTPISSAAAAEQGPSCMGASRRSMGLDLSRCQCQGGLARPGSARSWWGSWKAEKGVCVFLLLPLYRYEV